MTYNTPPITHHPSPITRLKVLTVVGTRPEIIRLSQVILKLDASPAIEHILVHTGQNYDYELNEVFFEDLGLRKPDYFLNAAGGNATSTAGQILINIDPVLESQKPDAFLVLGDTNSCLCAIAAKKRRIPIFHMEAGNRCFDQRVPEETNRKIVDHVSDINLTYSSIAREYLLREGLPADRIIKTGSPMFEVLTANMPQIDASEVLSQLSLKQQQYFVVSAHREENINNDKNFFGIINVLNQIADKYGYPIIVSTHPRTRKKLESVMGNELSVMSNELSVKSDELSVKSDELSVMSNESNPPITHHPSPITHSSPITHHPSPITHSSPITHHPSPITHSSPITHHPSPITLHPLIHFLKPLGFHDYNHLQKNAKAVLSDSGTISEESSIMNFPALNIREAHERPEAMEEASVMMVGLNPERIMQGLAILEDQKRDSARTLRPVGDYSMPNVSEKVVRIILGYTDYIKRTVWSEE